MKKLLLQVLAVACLFSGSAYAQSDSKAAKNDDKSKNSGKAGKSKSDKAGKGVKDNQNQTEYFKPDMEQKDYNFYDRKKISSPLMPRYDLDSAVYQKGFKKKEAQQKAFVNHKYNYPARPKDQWELGINFGSMQISGDLNSDPIINKGKGFPLSSVGLGISVRKALSYYFSVRFGYNFGIAYGHNWMSTANVAFDNAYNGTDDPRANYYSGVYKVKNPDGTTTILDQIPATERGYVFRNYRTMIHNVSVDGIFNLGNMMFHRERNIVNLNLIVGVGAQLSRTQIDALDQNNKMYRYQPIETQYNDLLFNQNASRSTVKKEILKSLKALQDGTYESDAEAPNNGFHARIAKYNFDPCLNLGVGLGFHVTKFMTIALEERVTLSQNDLYDGYQWQEDKHNGLTPNNDNIFYTSLQLLFHLGKNRVEPLYWLNPMDYTYKKISDANPDKIAAEILKDDDEDGVPNKLDKEPNTKKGCPVDVKGVALDSDKDGVADCDDKEPFSPPGYPIDQFGVAQIPPNPCCDNDTTGGGGMMGAGRGRKGGYDCTKIELPGVFFDDDKYYLNPEYMSALHQVAEKMQMCPDVKLVVTGYDESSNNQKYNEQLAYNRSTSVVDYLVEKYGIARDRFIVKYEGGKKASTARTPNERKQTRKVDFHYAADGDRGESNPPAPHPGLKAGSNK
ncbi:MAG: OmpA family protein [Chitinophagales bacterium]